VNNELEPRAQHAAESARCWGRDEAASSGTAALAKIRAVTAAAPDESEDGRLRLVLLAAAAAVVAVGGFGLVFAARWIERWHRSGDVPKCRAHRS